ncbi:MAG: M14 family metallopeptidase, partial [bacterium]|nr:M14 family metallopeptidase [bacterium]
MYKFSKLPVTGMILLVMALFVYCADNVPEELITVPEKSNYEATSTHADVMHFVNTIKELKSSLVHVETMAVSFEGKEIPLVVIADPKITTPDEAVTSGKPVIYVQGNIHAGEVEGKEALMLIMRDILFGDKKHLLDDQILLFCPIYNADGNDKMSEDNRRSQQKSPVLTGERTNGQGYDLNRDGIKAEGPETQGLLQNVLIKWDPVLLVDLHTTNGTMHGYSLTYAPNYPSAGHTATSEYVMDTMLPQIKDAVKSEYDLDMYLYGGFRIGGRGGQEWPPKSWDLWNILYQPRFLMNYVGLRNMMGILSETFAYDPFEKRIASAQAFTAEILEYTNKNGREMREVNKRAADETVQSVIDNGGTFTKGVKHRLIPYGEPFTLLTYKYTEQTDSTTGRVRWRATDELVEV